MATKKLRDFLDSHHVRYAVITHSPAFTSPEIAQSAHIPGKQLAKTVIIKADGRLVMAVLPSTQQVHTARQLASERDQLAKLFQLTPSFMTLLCGPDHVFADLSDTDAVWSAIAE